MKRFKDYWSEDVHYNKENPVIQMLDDLAEEIILELGETIVWEAVKYKLNQQ